MRVQTFKELLLRILNFIQFLTNSWGAGGDEFLKDLHQSTDFHGLGYPVPSKPARNRWRRWRDIPSEQRISVQHRAAQLWEPFPSSAHSQPRPRFFCPLLQKMIICVLMSLFCEFDKTCYFSMFFCWGKRSLFVATWLASSSARCSRSGIRTAILASCLCNFGTNEQKIGTWSKVWSVTNFITQTFRCHRWQPSQLRTRMNNIE